jgi:hypothetical protein
MPTASRALRGMLTARAGERSQTIQMCDVACHERKQHAWGLGVRRPPRLIRVVADQVRLLMPVERFDRGVEIENPRLAEQRPRAIAEVFPEPLCIRFFRDPAHRRRDRVGSQCGEILSITPVPASANNTIVAKMSRFASRHRRAAVDAARPTTVFHGFSGEIRSHPMEVRGFPYCQRRSPRANPRNYASQRSLR